MEFYMINMGLVGIIGEAYKIFFKNGKIMVSIVLLKLLIGLLLYLLNILSMKPLLNDLVTQQISLLVLAPGSPEFFDTFIHFKRDTGLVLVVQWIILFVSSMASLYLDSITILASAMVYRGKDLTFKDVLVTAARSWKRPIVTWFYTTIFGLGYFFVLFGTFLVPTALIVESPADAVIPSAALIVLAVLLYVYIAVIWSLALVISVLEEKCGIGAIRKAAQILKGMKVTGFLLNLLFTIVSCVIFLGLKVTSATPSMAVQILVGLLTTYFVYLVNIFWSMAHTIFYYQCKKTHGEEAELQGIVEYVKVPTAPQIGENIL